MQECSQTLLFLTPSDPASLEILPLSPTTPSQPSTPSLTTDDGSDLFDNEAMNLVSQVLSCEHPITLTLDCPSEDLLPESIIKSLRMLALNFLAQLVLRAPNEHIPQNNLTPLNSRLEVTSSSQISDERDLDVLKDSTSVRRTLKARPTKPIQVKIASRKKRYQANRIVTYPRLAGGETGARRIACLFRVCELVMCSLERGEVMTKRELFYKDKELFQQQRVVDDLIDDIAATLRITRRDLGVIAESKGLFAGTGIRIKLLDSGIVHGLEGNGGKIPPRDLIDKVELDEHIKGVLVVEKETAFQCLLKQVPNWILITGKGYPDIATREFVNLLEETFPSLKIFILSDADPDGVNIAKVYRESTTSLAHEGKRLIAKSIQRIGLGVNEVMSRCAVSMRLTQRDVDLGQRLIVDKNLPKTWRDELYAQLLFRSKAELESFDDLPQYVNNLLLSALDSSDNDKLGGFHEDELLEEIE